MHVTPLRHADLFHTGIVVSDVDSAKEEFGALGVTWGPEGDNEVPVILANGPGTFKFRYAYSAVGPHYLELVGALEGTLWTVTGSGHAHHLGYWSDDVTAASAALVALGMPRVAIMGTHDEEAPLRAVIHQAQNGLYIELLDRSSGERIFGAGRVPRVG